MVKYGNVLRQQTRPRIPFSSSDPIDKMKDETGDRTKVVVVGGLETLKR
jgi:hypothetical protein